jgi:hypothetical protein
LDKRRKANHHQHHHGIKITNAPTAFDQMFRQEACSGISRLGEASFEPGQPPRRAPAERAACLCELIYCHTSQGFGRIMSAKSALPSPQAILTARNGQSTAAALLGRRHMR